ncbi:MAG TPA: cytochrome c [Stellaceae bacterium]|jgi:mono/diheme cytochrome c family protein|nr:cytochrome c [Stellaceae bacterium]
MMRRVGVPILLALGLLAGCDKMANQKKQLPHEISPGQTSNPNMEPPAGIVARDEEPPPPPPPVTLALLQRGQERFNIFCSPCHGRVGDGHGMIVERGFPAPPSYFIDRLLAAPSQHFYDVITNGYGAMFSYADRVTPADRWAIAAYIRALQASQHAAIAQLSPSEKAALP